MTNKDRLKQVRIMKSPITDKSYLCFVKGNIITEKIELTEQDLREFCFVSAIGLFSITGATVEEIADVQHERIVTISLGDKNNDE